MPTTSYYHGTHSIEGDHPSHIGSTTNTDNREVIEMGGVQIYYYTGKNATYQLSASEDDRGVICGGIGIYGGNLHIKGLDIVVYTGWDDVQAAFEEKVDAYENNGQFRPVGGWWA